MENSKRFPQLCGDKDCTGCSSCAQSCSHSAISLVYNREGYYNPQIDVTKCVGCFLCEKKCPVINPLDKNKNEPSAYASWINDKEARTHSSSGGAFTAIAKVIFSEGGVVWGAGYSDDMVPEYRCIDKVEELDKLRGSKYVQCRVGDAYKTIKEQLGNGKRVLFCGTPCHVAGLYSFLNKKDAENLLTIDFICHGVPAPKLFGNYIKWLESKFGDKAIDFNFRESKFGINYNIGTSVTFDKKGKKFLYLSKNSYTLGFCKDLTIHEVCGNCKFNGTHRHSDFTLGDFHGAKGEYSAFEQFDGISCLIVNSSKGEEMLNSLDIYRKEIPLERIIRSNPSYTRHKPSNKTLDLQELVNRPYDEIQKSYFKPNQRDIIKTATMLIMGGRLSYIIKNIM